MPWSRGVLDSTCRTPVLLIFRTSQCPFIINNYRGFPIMDNSLLGLAVEGFHKGAYSSFPITWGRLTDPPSLELSISSKQNKIPRKPPKELGACYQLKLCLVRKTICHTQCIDNVSDNLLKHIQWINNDKCDKKRYTLWLPSSMQRHIHLGAYSQWKGIHYHESIVQARSYMITTTNQIPRNYYHKWTPSAGTPPEFETSLNSTLQAHAYAWTTSVFNARESSIT